jgi:hypothetical protein
MAGSGMYHEVAPHEKCGQANSVARALTVATIDELRPLLRLDAIHLEIREPRWLHRLEQVELQHLVRPQRPQQREGYILRLARVP